MRIPDDQKKKRDPEGRRVSARRSKTKATLKKKGFAGPTGDLTVQQWKLILQAFAGNCAYCGMTAKSPTMDHIKPASKGGRHTALNVVPACFLCNLKKKDKIVTPSFYPADWPEIEQTLKG